MIFVFAEGGSGSVYFSRRVKVAMRPDTVWGFAPDLKIKFPSENVKGFKARSGFDANLNGTIEQNLVEMLNWREEVLNQHTMLSGRCSQTTDFLTNNFFKGSVICFIRHPLHAFVSFLSQRHPEHAREFGGFNTEEAVRFYAGLWNNMVSDFIASDNTVYRFEYMPNEIMEKWLKHALNGWDNTIRNYNQLDPALEDLLQELVEGVYFQLYEEWVI